MNKFWQMVKTNLYCYLLFLWLTKHAMFFLSFGNIWNLQNFCYLVTYFYYFRFPQFPHHSFCILFETWAWGTNSDVRLHQTIIIYCWKTLFILEKPYWYWIVVNLLILNMFDQYPKRSQNIFLFGPREYLLGIVGIEVRSCNFCWNDKYYEACVYHIEALVRKCSSKLVLLKNSQISQ